MIDSIEVAKIKEYQKDFEDTFGKRLEIDWWSMKGGPKRTCTFRYRDINYNTDPAILLKEAAERHGASIAKIKDRRVRISNAKTKERLALIDYCTAVLESRLNVGQAAKLINRDRTLIYYFAETHENPM